MRDVELGEVLTSDRQPVALEPETEYPTVGILSYGRGLFARPIVRGRDVSYSKYFRVQTDQFIYSKLFAWEGALTLVPEGFDGFFVSPEFPTFTVNLEAALPGYIRLLTTWPKLWDRLRAGESGMGGRRKRLKPDQLLATSIPLPTIEHQARIVDLLDGVDGLVAETEAHAAASSSFAAQLRAEMFVALLSAESAPLSERVEVTNGRQRSPKHATGDHMLRYVRAANVKDGRLVLDEPKFMNFTPREQERYRLADGDVLVTEGCGSLKQIGASCEWNGELDGTVCFQNHLLRLRSRRRDQLLQRFVYHWARWAFQAGMFARVTTGTNVFSLGKKRVEALPFPLVAINEQQRILSVLDPADDVAAASDHLTRATHIAGQVFSTTFLRTHTEFPTHTTPSWSRSREQADGVRRPRRSR